jgi:hypothetical protein
LFSGNTDMVNHLDSPRHVRNVSLPSVELHSTVKTHLLIRPARRTPRTTNFVGPATQIIEIRREKIARDPARLVRVAGLLGVTYIVAGYPSVGMRSAR